ncbi:hypothetical protein DDE74_01735 [Streptomyces lydicus]|uniref:DUF2530 domain-containing protein n=1 Tax=Streptomyces lydicus TaxID=47763 RepID=A0A3S9Y497_9ACTN|nr:hypothetical protein DDE74_01735 [Streptomyces lydicus]
MRQHPGLTGRRGPSYGERCLFSIALVAVSLLWITQDMAPWATALCGAGAIAGALGVFYFGRRYIRSRGDSQ